MKKFIFYCILFLLAGSVLFHIKPFCLLYNDKYKQVVSGDEIYYSIQKSKSKTKNKKVLLGDSVAKQLFDNKGNTSTITSLACNQSIGMVGQFILLENYLNAGNQVDIVYLLFQPFTFRNNLDQVYTYHYFLKPFYKKEYIEYFSNTVKQQIYKIPYHQLCWYPSILTSNWAPDFKSTDKISYTFLSPVSIEYLNKMKELARKQNFQLVILPTPISLARKHEVESMNKEEIQKGNFGNEFNNYFENIMYFPDSNFSDGNHFKNPSLYAEYYKSRFLR